MKPKISICASLRSLLLPAVACAGLALGASIGALQSQPAHGATVELATAPLVQSTSSPVKPNIMFVLDDSGSMGWDYMPDTARDFAGKYGFNSSQCNGVYYNPSITYTAPVDATGAPLNATATTFSTAYRNGYNTSFGTRDLSLAFSGGSGSGSPAFQSIAVGPAFYFNYGGNQNTAAKRDYLNSSSLFYQECNSDIGATTVIDGAAVNTRFALVRLALVPTTTITVGSGATITLTSDSNSKSISNVQVSGTAIMSSGATSSSTSAQIVAGFVAAKINACTAGGSGCVTSGYSAIAAGSTVNIFGPASAAGASVNVTVSSSGWTVNTTAFPAASATTVSSITVGGTSLLSSSATGTVASVLATDIKNKISATGYSATVLGNVVTITAPASASLLTPVISSAAGMTLTTQAFPESTPAKLQNFANWYSYYSHRMLMMKTGAGLAFQKVSDKFRVGFLTMNNNVSPGIVEVDTFAGTQKSNWFSKLYASTPGNSTPLREILSRAGQYYAHKFGNITTYQSTITVSGSSSTTVSSLTVNGFNLLFDNTLPNTTNNAVAAAINDQINAKVVTDYGSTVSGNVVTIFGPASAVGFSPVVTTSGGMTFGVSSFTTLTSTSTLNGILPADPIQYSCQQNFTILSTDGYWNGPNTFDLSNNPVGQVDGKEQRPYNDGGISGYNYSYTRNTFSLSSTGCSSGQKRLVTQPQQGPCLFGDNTTGCTPPSWSNSGASSASSCSASNTSAPSPSSPVLSGTPVLQGTAGVANTLADVALYYYKTDLRDESLGNCTGVLGTDVCDNNVFTTDTDPNKAQHMTTFTLGLGARGRMVYSSSYLTDTSGDFFAVKQGSIASATVCTWQTAGTVCNWPVPSSGAPETIDDMWHAAVNGRGSFFSATDPVTLANGLSSALGGIRSKEGAAAAAATSTLNPVAGNNLAFVASYTTTKWTGNIEARGIHTDTGAVNENATWCLENVPAGTCDLPAVIGSDTSGDTTSFYCAKPGAVQCVGGTMVGTECRVPVATACTGTMNARVTDTADTRNIYTAKLTVAGSTRTNSLIPFDLTFRAANPAYFDATLLANLSQWPPATDTSANAVYFKANAVGDNLLSYLRGQKGHEMARTGVAAVDQFYRSREAVIGDELESQPAFLGAPTFNYPYFGYQEFKTAKASRPGTVYFGANDGMLHAIASADGAERWDYIPSMVVPNLWQLANGQYADKHRNYVNGTPITSDICVANCNTAYSATSPGTNPVWKTILVAGLNGGGRGYYAMDITDPASPSMLWEFTTTGGIGAATDNDLGFTFGQPVVTQKADGTWVVVVTSGYDNGTDSPFKNSGGAFIANSPAGTGRGYLYVLNANTGTIISKIDTLVGTAASPIGLSRISGFNTDVNGNRAGLFYGGDLLGNVWRFDINSTTSAVIGTGSAFKLATLYSDTSGTLPQPITTAPQLGKILNKRVVFVGTGKYLELGDQTSTQVQTQYAIKDDDATTTFNNPRNSLVQQYLINAPSNNGDRLSSGANGTTATNTNAVDWTTGRGWFVDFPVSKERVNIDSKLVLGTLLVPTIVPNATACSPGGTGFLNFFNYLTGGSVTAARTASVSYSSPIVGINVIFINGAPIVLVTSSDQPTPQGAPKVQFAGGAAGFAGKRVLWRELIP